MHTCSRRQRWSTMFNSNNKDYHLLLVLHSRAVPLTASSNCPSLSWRPASSSSSVCFFFNTCILFQLGSDVHPSPGLRTFQVVVGRRSVCWAFHSSNVNWVIIITLPPSSTSAACVESFSTTLTSLPQSISYIVICGSGINTLPSRLWWWWIQWSTPVHQDSGGESSRQHLSIKTLVVVVKVNVVSSMLWRWLGDKEGYSDCKKLWQFWLILLQLCVLFWSSGANMYRV